MFVIKTLIKFLKNPEYRSLLVASSLVVLMGTIFYHFVEGWTWLDSLYFSTITLTTVGYGDFSPQTELGKGFTIIYILIGVGLILAFINTVYDHFKNESRWEKKQLRSKLKRPQLPK